MTTLTIPKELIKKGDLVLVPKDEYEELLRKYKRIHGIDFRNRTKKK